MIKTEVQHESKSGSEYGYGLYINVYIIDDGEKSNTIWASECVAKDASPETIKAATKRARARARHHYKKAMAD